MRYRFITRNHIYYVHKKDIYYPEDVAEIITAILKHEKVDFSRVNIKDYEDKQVDEFHLN